MLTYDDGPSGMSQALLDLLRERKVKATFFLLGCNVTSKRDLAGRFVEEGHEVGSHTDVHHNAWKTTPTASVRDIIAGRQAIEAIGGEADLFRPPYGKLTLATLLYGMLHGVTFGWWTIDSRDSWRRRTIEDVLAEIDRRQGGVVLMHDFVRPADGPGHLPHRDHVLQLTGRIIDHAERHGYQLTTLGDIEGRPSPWPRVVHA